MVFSEKAEVLAWRFVNPDWPSNVNRDKFYVEVEVDDGYGEKMLVRSPLICPEPGLESQTLWGIFGRDDRKSVVELV